jgi:hypothetical protein
MALLWIGEHAKPRYKKATDSVSNDAAADSAHAASQYPNNATDAGNPHQKNY